MFVSPLAKRDAPVDAKVHRMYPLLFAGPHNIPVLLPFMLGIRN